MAKFVHMLTLTAITLRLLSCFIC